MSLKAAMSPELQKRVQTAALGGVAFILVVIFGGRIGAGALAAGLSLAMMFEYIELTFSLPDKHEKKMVMLGTVWLIAFINFWIPRAEFELLIATFLGVFAYFLFSAERHEPKADAAGAAPNALTQHFQELMFALFGLLYLGFVPLYFVLVHDSPGGVHWTLVLLLIVWGGDTGAYFAGKKYGRHKLYAAISPKKTFEGAVGGLLTGLALTAIYKLAIFRTMPWGAVVLTPLLVGVFAQVGDLCESFLKRAYHAKDSGSILPGHGGFLDRFDGLVFSLPVMYACVRVFGL